MCGVAGFLARSPRPGGEEILRRMGEALAHRGPDDTGTWSDPASGIHLGHRRLSIIDLSSTGHQPMVSHCGRYVLVFNGEIYNHLDLRRALGSHVWRGQSDTETLLACFTHFGIARALEMAFGMFAFAVWDVQQRTLTLARDRMGEKPLYYGTLPSGDFVFASEIKALRAHPHWRGEIDRDALTLFLRHNCIPSPWSIYRGIRKVRPGHLLSVSADGQAQETTYWNVVEVAKSAQAQRSRPLSDMQAVERLENVLGQAVRDQMLSDVPLGAFLSGGVDSSTIVALMMRQAAGNVRTFTIGFEQAGYNEAEHAKAVAQHLGTDHTEFYVSASDALAVIPLLPQIYDEPFADSSQVPTFLLARMARRHVTVALSGDAGDELFCGYSRYLLALKAWRWLARVPLKLRRRLAHSLLTTRPATWDALMRAVAPLLPERLRHGAFGDKMHKFADSVLGAESQALMYRALVSHWQRPAQVVLGSSEPSTLLDSSDVSNALDDPVERMSLMDQITYLPDDILVKVDRAAMAVSLESRAPLLDPRVVELAWQTPLHQKVRHGQSKWLLRQVLYRHVPRELIDRPKQGFAIPLEHWLRGPLRDWAESLLAEDRLSRDGYFNVRAVRDKWREHVAGRRNWQYLLWDILMFQAWHESSAQAGNDAVIPELMSTTDAAAAKAARTSAG